MENEKFIYTKKFETAQQYELKANNHFAENDKEYLEYSKRLLSRIDDFKKTGVVDSYFDERDDGWIGEFFSWSKDEFLKFNEEVKDKTNLEIGSGPCGHLNVWFWMKNRIIIEPLIDGYRQQQMKIHNKTWFTDDLTLYSQPAEIEIPELVNKIDGFIICRNCLDHSQDWMNILKNIQSYAVSGSLLILWTDLYHGTNGGDSGHFNITNDKAFFENSIKELGYEIIKNEIIPQGAARSTLNYGCIARKI